MSRYATILLAIVLLTPSCKPIAADSNDHASHLADQLAAEWTLRPLLLMFHFSKLTDDRDLAGVVAATPVVGDPERRIALYVLAILKEPVGDAEVRLQEKRLSPGSQEALRRWLSAQIAFTDAFNTAFATTGADVDRALLIAEARLALTTLAANPATVEPAALSDLLRLERRLNSMMTPQLAKAFVAYRTTDLSLLTDDRQREADRLEIAVCNALNAYDPQAVSKLARALKNASPDGLQASREQVQKLIRAAVAESKEAKALALRTDTIIATVKTEELQHARHAATLLAASAN